MINFGIKEHLSELNNGLIFEIEEILGGSSICEELQIIKINDSLKTKSLKNIKTMEPYTNLLDELFIGTSSVFQNIVFIDKPSVTFEKSDFRIKESDMEKDLIFKMSPKRKYKIELNINSIKKAIPKFFSEDFKL